MSITPRNRLQDRLTDDLAAVAAARLCDLRQIWLERLGAEPPAALRSREILRRMLAYRLQATALGDLSAPARRKLKEIEARRATGAKPAPAPAKLNTGAKLVREWKGVPHEVWVIDGAFVHEGETYKSLSEVARAITGTRWNGPLFFGLRDKMKVAA